MEEIRKEYSDMEIYCIAKILQSAIFSYAVNGASGIFYGCRYCKYKNECMPEGVPHKDMMIDKLRRKLQKHTGVDLDCFTKSNKFTDISMRKTREEVTGDDGGTYE